MIEFIVVFLLGLGVLGAGVYALCHPNPEDDIFTLDAVSKFIAVVVLGKKEMSATHYFDGEETESSVQGEGEKLVNKDTTSTDSVAVSESKPVAVVKEMEFQKKQKLLQRLIRRCGNAACPHHILGLKGVEEKKKLSACVQCKTVGYCSKDCQKDDWKNHKGRCKIIHKMKTEGKFPIVGVSLKWFLSDPVHEKMLEVRTTQDAIHHVFIKMTENDNCSVAEYLAKTSPHLVKPVADTFVSHVWASDVEDLLEALFSELKEWCENDDLENKEEDVFIWADFLCLNQHEPIIKNNEFWTSYFPECMQVINHTTVIASVLQNPAFLHRSWCLWEIAHHEGEFRIGIRKEQRALLWNALKREPIVNIFKTIGDNIDFGTADAQEPEVKEYVLECIKNWKDGGHQKVGNIIMKSIRSWLIQEGEAVIAQMETEFSIKNQTRPPGISDMLAKQEEHCAIASTCEKLHWLTHNQQMLAESEIYARKALEIYTEVFGNDHLKTAGAHDLIAVSLGHMNKRDEALSELNESVRVYRMFNERNLLASSLVNIGCLYQAKDMFAEAQAPFTEALAMVRQIHNNRPHPEVSEVLNHLANVNFKLGRISAAHGQLSEAVGILRNVAPNYPRLKMFETGMNQLKLKLDADAKATAAAKAESKPITTKSHPVPSGGKKGTKKN